MTTYYVRDNDRQQIRQLRTFKDEVTPVSVDFSAWAEDNGAVTTATWAVISGSATVSGTSLALNVATGTVTTASRGSSLIEIKGAGATNTKILKLRVYAKDPYQATNDYGFNGG